jgi:hypothetical protein
LNLRFTIWLIFTKRFTNLLLYPPRECSCMRGSGLAALAFLLLLSAALPLCSAVPDSVEWPRPSAGPAPQANPLALSIVAITDVGGRNSSGELVLRVLDSNGTAVQNATVFAFSSEEVEFDRCKAATDPEGNARFNFTVVAEPYEGMAAVASAMKSGYADADILVQIVEAAPEPVAEGEASAPRESPDSWVVGIAGAVGAVSFALYLYWKRGM